MFHIVLVEPLIPQNTGNIARLCAATGSRLHLIEPLGFEVSDSRAKRAGLDYWPYVDWEVHSSWEAFLAAEPRRCWFTSSHATRPYYEADFQDGDALVFGNESTGLGNEFRERYSDCFLLLPMDNPKVRSLNLGNTATALLYEARRQVATRIGG